MKWPLTTEKPETFLADKENRQGYIQAYLLTEKICSNKFPLTYVKNEIQVCKCHKSPCKFSILVNVFYFTQVVYCMETIFFKLFARWQTRDMSPNPFTWR